MSDLLSDYFDEVGELQHQESEALVLVLFSMRRAAIEGSLVDFVRVWEQVELLKESLARRKDLLEAARATNKRKRQSKGGRAGTVRKEG